MTLDYRILTTERIKLLRKALEEKKVVRIMEAHNALSGLIVNNAAIHRGVDDTVEFDGIWISSFTDSAAKGHPDIGVIDSSSRLKTIQEIAYVTNKPLVVDGETGGEESHFEYYCSKLEAEGVSAVIVEDKRSPKRNSMDRHATHLLEDPKVFARKINRAKQACLSKDFMIFARIESLNANQDLTDAALRARTYLDSDADGILIHSRKTSPEQILDFMEIYLDISTKAGIKKPIACIPTTYHQVYESELIARGFDFIIYANQLLRASHKAMREVCNIILSHQRGLEAEQLLSSMNEIGNETGLDAVKKRDIRNAGK